MTDTIENTRVMYEPSANSDQFVKTSTTNPCHSENKVLFVGSIWMRNSFMHFPETMKSTVHLTRQENHVFIYFFCYHVARVYCTFCLFTLLDKSFKKCDRYIYLSLNNFKTFVYFYIILIRIVSIYFIKIAISLFFIILG